MYCNKEDYLVDDKLLNDGVTYIESDDLYKNDAGEVIGTYLFREIQSGDGYKLDGGEMWPVDSTGKILGDSVDVAEGIKVVMKRNNSLKDGVYGHSIDEFDGEIEELFGVND